MNDRNKHTSSWQMNALVAEGDYAKAARLLLNQQKEVWNDLLRNYENLASVKTKTIWFDGFRIKVQFNPGRVKSSSADVDDESIKNRECFLCSENLPREQKGISILNDYIILCNPHPIFSEHFTIVAKKHKPQEIYSTFEDYLEISEKLKQAFTLIYNGPNCGASAPDHLHFQAGTKNFMPIEDDFHPLVNEYGEIISIKKGVTVSAIDDGLRKFISLESMHAKYLQKVFISICKEVAELYDLDKEPMLNIISQYSEENGWRVILFFRTRHRSSHYFLNSDEKLMFSPAAIDIGGVCITPLEKDFLRTDKNLVEEVFEEIFPFKSEFDNLKLSLKKI